MELTMQSVPTIPPGSYVGRFLGVKPQPPKVGGGGPVIGRDGQPLPPGIIWAWEITQGDYAGQVADRMTGATPTARSTCGQFVLAVTGESFEAGKRVNLDQFAGTIWRFRIEPKDQAEGTRVSLIGLSRAYDLEARPGTSPGGQHQSPPPDDDGGASIEPDQDQWYIRSGVKGEPPLQVTRTALLAMIRAGDVGPLDRVCRMGDTAWRSAAQAFPGPDFWGPAD